jgi:hypothetical protein
MNGGDESAIIRTRALTKVHPGADFAAVDQLDLSIQQDQTRLLVWPAGHPQSRPSTCSRQA